MRLHWRPTPTDPLTILASNDSRALVFCACDKCGSTSAYQFLYSGLYGKPFTPEATRTKATSIQNHAEWVPRLPTVAGNTEAQLPRTGTTYLALARDPLARYVSAYKSKLACTGAVDLHDRT